MDGQGVWIENSLDVMREVAMKARRAGCDEDRRSPGSDLAKLLCNCDRFMELMIREIEQLRAYHRRPAAIVVRGCGDEFLVHAFESCEDARRHLDRARPRGPWKLVDTDDGKRWRWYPAGVDEPIG